MSTRANIVLKDGINTLYFYKHHDGYPTGTHGLGTRLAAFLATKEAESRRDDIEYLGGYLINFFNKDDTGFPATPTVSPAIGIHGDIEWLYTIDARTLELTTEEI